MRPGMKSTRNEISIYYERNSVYVTFHCRQNETNLVLGVARDKRPIKEKQKQKPSVYMAF